MPLTTNISFTKKRNFSVIPPPDILNHDISDSGDGEYLPPTESLLADDDFSETRVALVTATTTQNHSPPHEHEVHHTLAKIKVETKK